MGIIIARAVNLIAVGLLAGNEFGSLLNVHPAFDDLALPTRVRAEQAIMKRYGKAMPFFMSGTIASFLPVLDEATASSPRSSSARAAWAFIAMLVTTLAGNVLINNELLRLDAATMTEPAFDDMRSRWTRLHRIRNAMNITGLLLRVAALFYCPGTRR